MKLFCQSIQFTELFQDSVKPQLNTLSVRFARPNRPYIADVSASHSCLLQGPSAESSPAKPRPAAGLAGVPALKFAQRYGAPDPGAVGDYGGGGAAGGGGGAEPDRALGLNGSSAPAGAPLRSGHGPRLSVLAYGNP